MTVRVASTVVTESELSPVPTSAADTPVEAVGGAVM